MEQLYNGLNDPQFSKPYVDDDEWRDVPVRHHYIHGGFEGTEARFCFYFPPKETYAKRFFHNMSAFAGDERAAQFEKGQEKIAFAVSHGAYLVETNQGGGDKSGDNSLIYRSNASTAQYSRALAVQFYGEHRPYGYIFGGSGGGYKSISCVECTEGVWDGAVPFVIGSPVALPNVFTMRMHALRILRNKLEEICDALEPGGSGDPYACLNEEEKEALREAELMGFPMKAWCVYETLGQTALPVLVGAVESLDPSYYTDFWEKEGYLGTLPDSSATRDRIKMECRITAVYDMEQTMKTAADTIDEGNAYGVDEAWKHGLNKGRKLPVFQLDSFPDAGSYLEGLKLQFLSGELAGLKFRIYCLDNKSVTVNGESDGRDLEQILLKAKVGDCVLLDNSDFIALQTYHRHQIPGLEYHAWDQFRDKNGEPLYPQRTVQVSPVLTGSVGSVQKGTPTCKLIVLESLMDESALPWQADWYRNEVAKHYSGNIEDKMRLWYMENCMHTDCTEGNAGDHQHIVSYGGALNQALLDLSDWVERGIAPAATSEYTVDQGRVTVPEKAVQRRGIQPVVTLRVNGGEKATVKVGEKVLFSGTVELPNRDEVVEDITWDFEATNQFQKGGCLTPSEDGSCAEVKKEYCFSRPGTYFPVMRAASNRTSGDSFTRVLNMARVRVIVENDEI